MTRKFPLPVRHMYFVKSKFIFFLMDMQAECHSELALNFFVDVYSDALSFSDI